MPPGYPTRRAFRVSHPHFSSLSSDGRSRRTRQARDAQPLARVEGAVEVEFYLLLGSFIAIVLLLEVILIEIRAS